MTTSTSESDQATSLGLPHPTEAEHSSTVWSFPRASERELRHPLAAGVLIASTWSVAFPGSPLRSIGVAVCLAVAAATVTAVATRSTRSVLLCLAATSFLPWLAIRHSSWLTIVNLVAYTVVLLSAFSTPIDGHPKGARAFVQRVTTTWLTGFRGPEVVGHTLKHSLEQSQFPRDRFVRAARAAVVPVLISLGCLLLLASGDALFASYFDVDWLVSFVAVRLGAAVVGLAVFTWMLGAARVIPQPCGDARQPTPISVLLTLGGLAITMSAYGATQLSAALLGADYVTSRTGLSYADYARSGFFQLVAVAAIAAVAVAAARPAVVTGSHRRATLWLAAVLTGGVLAMVASSVLKLAIYTDRFGLTMLRLYTIVFATWIGLAVVLTFTALLRRRHQWLVPTVLATITVGAFAMNIANPERLVAEHNLHRVEAGAELDIEYLDRLSADAAPTILSSLANLSAAQREALSRRWCYYGQRTEPITHGGFGWNLSAARASQARTQYCR